MKNYRTSVADAFAMMCVLESIAENADTFAKSAAEYAQRAAENSDSDDSYWIDQSLESTAKAEAFERLIAKLSK